MLMINYITLISRMINQIILISGIINYITLIKSINKKNIYIQKYQ